MKILLLTPPLHRSVALPSHTGAYFADFLTRFLKAGCVPAGLGADRYEFTHEISYGTLHG